MRTSAMVQLSLLPILASAAIASADVPAEPVLAPPGMVEPTDPQLMPPGMTPTIDELACEDDPSWDLRPDCQVDDRGVIRGGFGTYFYVGGG